MGHIRIKRLIRGAIKSALDQDIQFLGLICRPRAADQTAKIRAAKIDRVHRFAA